VEANLAMTEEPSHQSPFGGRKSPAGGYAKNRALRGYAGRLWWLRSGGSGCPEGAARPPIPLRLSKSTSAAGSKVLHNLAGRARSPLCGFAVPGIA
jgi:hypothetical protein